MSKSSTERQLLLKSHSKERTDELMNERYSLAGKQTPVLVVKGTQGTLADNKERRIQRRKKAHQQKKKVYLVKPARDALKGFIDDVRKGVEEVHYSDFEELHQVWKTYIGDLLGNNEQNNIITGKLASADFHGASLRVVRAKNPSVVGIEGIVCWEARTTFVMVTPGNAIKMVDKVGSVFRIQGLTQNANLEIVGSRFVYRTADRSGRKFKSHRIDDLVC